jgi:hypothetical protein
MPKKVYPFREGDWFTVPLGNGGYALDLVARMDRAGGILALFFGPRCSSIPTFEEIGPRTPGEVVLVANTGPVGFTHGDWRVVGPSEHWDRTEWPMPVFGRYDGVTDKAWRVYYAEDDLVQVVRKEPVTVAEARLLPRDEISGDLAVQKVLTRLLGQPAAAR